MSKKSKQEEVIVLGGENSQATLTETALSDPAGSLPPGLNVYEKLLGAPIAFESLIGKKVLLRLQRMNLENPENLEALSGFVSSEQVQEMQLLPYDALIVLGPFDLELTRKIIHEGAFNTRIDVHESYLRWKPLLSVFPDLKDSFRVFQDTENTNSVTQTETMTGSQNIQLEEVSEVSHFESSEENITANVMNDETISLDKEEIQPTLTPEKFLQKKAVPQNSIRFSKTARTQAWNPRVLWVVLAVGSGVIFLLNKISQNNNVSALPLDTQKSLEKISDRPLADAVSEFPDYLAPILPVELTRSESPIVERVKKIMFRYQAGATALSLEDEQSLRRMADPASSSWEARRLAVNQLAAFLLSAGRIEDAAEIVENLFNSSSADFSTLMNRSLVKMLQGSYDQALESVLKAEEFSPRGAKWLSFSMRELIESRKKSSHSLSLEKYYLEAKNSNKIQPIVDFLHLKNVGFSEGWKILKIVDPGVLWDAPIAAPIASNVLKTEAALSLDKWLQSAKNSRPEEILWVRLISKILMNESVVDIYSEYEKLYSLLETTDLAPETLFHFSFVEFEKKNFEKALVYLEKASLIPLFADNSNFAVTLWVLKGDIFFELNKIADAKSAYQMALQKSSLDVRAKWGLFLVERALRNDRLASQLLEEVLGSDSFFIPSLLRMSRLRWRLSQGRE